MIPLSRTAIFTLVATLALAGCSDMPTLPAEGAPDELSFSIAGYGVGSVGVHLRGDAVVLRRAPWDYTPGTTIDSVRVVPTADAWRAFWAAAEDAGVRRWQARYLAEHVQDGVGWSLRIRAGGQVLESQGSNAFPDRRGRAHAMEMTDDFRALLAALGELVGQPLQPFGG